MVLFFFFLFFLTLLRPSALSSHAYSRRDKKKKNKKHRGRSAVSVTTQAAGRPSSLNTPRDPFRIKDGGDAVRGTEITLPHCPTNERWFELLQNKVTMFRHSFFVFFCLFFSSEVAGGGLKVVLNVKIGVNDEENMSYVFEKVNERG